MDSQLLLTGNPAVMPRMDSQRRGPEVLLWEIAIDLLEARLWTASEGEAAERRLSAFVDLPVSST